MSQETWSAVDACLADALIGNDAILEAALRDSEKAGLPAISVSPPQGRFLNLLARVQGARNILEIGTLGGYSAIWLARALPPGGGRLVTLEVDAKHADVARANLARAGFANIAQVRLGRAIDTLPELEREGAGPFDFVFIDADKPSNPDYFTWAIALSRRGTVIVVDNVVRAGAVADAASRDAAVLGVRRLIQMMGMEKRVSATAIQTVGSKGYDGFAVALVIA
ncbi:MAG TPA: O-methyltransferase [Usitatibacteraceae bacterium]|nr:O-methyltransferase [Usitatibacteraceae bacterium]